MFRREKIPHIAVDKDIRSARYERSKKMLARIGALAAPAFAFLSLMTAGYVLSDAPLRARTELAGSRAVLQDAEQEIRKRIAMGEVMLNLGRVQTGLDISTARRALASDPVIGKIDYDVLERIRHAFIDGAPRRTYLAMRATSLGLNSAPQASEIVFGPQEIKAQIQDADLLAELVAREIALPAAFSECGGQEDIETCLSRELPRQSARIRKEFLP